MTKGRRIRTPSFCMSFLPCGGLKYTRPMKRPEGVRKENTPMGKEKYGTQYAQFVSNRKKILATESICAICGKPVDKSLKFPHPMSASVDHIIPWDKGGDCSLDNLQLAHFCCNRRKSDRILPERTTRTSKKIGNQTLPLSADWATF